MTKKPPPRRKPGAGRPAAGKPSSGRSLGPWLVGGGVAAVVLVAFVVASMSGGDPADDSGLVEVAPVTVSGSALPSAPDQGSPDPAVGLPAPSLAGVSFDEAAVTIDNSDGRPKALIFLAHW